MNIILRTFAVLLFSSFVLYSNAKERHAEISKDKPCIVVLTDIAPGHIEPDDMESMIRLLVHSDLFEIEALIATSGWNNSGGDYPGEWMDSLLVCLNAYEKDLPNLMRRSGQMAFLPLEEEEKSQKIGYWPSSTYLRNRTMRGSQGLGLKRIGNNNDSEGSDYIIQLLQEKDRRPLWILAWGGANTLAQAIWKMRQQYDDSQWKEMLEKLCVYTITDQDVGWGERSKHLISSHYWMRKECGKSLRFIWDESAWLTQNEIGSKNWAEYAKHIQGHGHLGSIYPKNKWGVEGDTPSFLHVMPTGLNAPSVFDNVGWGGFFQWGLSADGETSCYTNIAPEVKRISRKYEEYFYPVVFNNFAARMDWAKEGKGNHNPIVYINKNGQPDIIYLTAKVGKRKVIDSSKTYDPDGDALQYKWWVLPEAGTYKQKVVFENADTDRVTITIPTDLGKESIHLILEVTDTGTPALTSYRRVVITAR